VSSAWRYRWRLSPSLSSFSITWRYSEGVSACGFFFFSPFFSSSVFSAFFYANQKIKDVMGWDEAF
jgi:hypothetical protein